MANLQKNAIELVTKYNHEKDEVEETQTYFTPQFIPLKTIYEAIDLTDKIQENPDDLSVRDLDKELMAFVANKVYAKQFTADDLLNGLHAPNAREELMSQITFLSSGQQSAQGKKLTEKTN